MLDYEWGNTSTIILAGNEGAGGTESDQIHRQIFEHNYTMLPDPILHGSTTTGFSHHHHFNPPQLHQHQHQYHPFFDPRAFQSAFTTSFSPPPSMLSLNPIPPLGTSHCGHGLLLMPKSEDASSPMIFEGSGPGLGLNLGGRTYFASCNVDIVNRLYRSAKAIRSVSTVSSNLPRCQVEGCNVDLSDAKHYHRRHKVCEFHSKAATVIAAGLTLRFCQQCSRLWFFWGNFTQWRNCHWVFWFAANHWLRCDPEGISVRIRFHLLSEFDNGKRSCRKRLADHNRRRRKTHQPAQEINKSQPSMDNVARSSTESGVQSSSLNVAVSPTDYLQQRPNRNRGSSSTTSGSLFFSSG